MKQTAVEYLIESLGEYFPNDVGGIELVIKKAKEIEKQQIVDAVNKFALSSDEVVRIILKKYNLLNTGEAYYNETYESKGSDKTKPHSFCETPEEKCTMSYCDENGCINRKRNLVSESIEKTIIPFQTEISDEEIEKEAESVYPISKEYKEKYKTIYDDFNTCWKEGAKWYREQLKNN